MLYTLVDKTAESGIRGVIANPRETAAEVLRPRRGPNFWRYVAIYAVVAAASVATAATRRGGSVLATASFVAGLAVALYTNTMTDACIASGSRRDPTCASWGVMWMVVSAITAAGAAITFLSL